MYKFTLSGVEIRRTFRPNRTVRGAITALDLKITDFKEKLGSNRYRNSTESTIEASEILGEIKFMYLSGLLTGVDYRRVVNHVTGQSFDEEDSIVYPGDPNYFTKF